MRTAGRYFATTLLLTAACYRYAPLQGSAPDAGKPVRVHLTEQGSIDLAPLIGPTILTLDGALTAVRDTALVLAVTNAIARNGVENHWTGEPVIVPRRAVKHVELRELDKRRSWFVAAGGVGAVVAAGVGFNLLGGAFGGKNAPKNGGPR